MIGDQPLHDLLLRDVSLVDHYKQVHDYWLPGIGWDCSLLDGLIPPQIEDRIVVVVLYEDELTQDDFC